MDLNSILANHEHFKEKVLTDRFFKHSDLVGLLKQLSASFEISELGESVQGRSINIVKYGKGPVKVLLWSQMHGDEATGTMAMFDLFNFLQTEHPSVKQLEENCQMFFIPMVNPDGAEIFTRRNHQQIDINRDFLKETSPEARILKQASADIKPDFGFNLHDQLTTWSVSGSLKPATLSFLAPAYNEALEVNENRKNAMLVIAAMFNELSSQLTEQIGLFNDEFEPRAFGDNFQLAGMATILIEAGGYKEDFEKQQIRKFYFGAMLSGLFSIASKSYEQQNLDHYFSIPKNNEEIFHYLIHNVRLNGIEVSIGINYDEFPAKDGRSTSKIYSIQDIGDLSFCGGYSLRKSTYEVEGEVVYGEKANFKLLEGNQVILAFENGILR